MPEVRRWSAVLARIGTPTGDKRIIAPGALTNRDLPLPLMWQRVSSDGHSGSVTVGAIETLTIDNESGMVMGTGSFLPVRGAAEAQAQTEAGVTGPSVDLFDDVDIMEVQTLIEAGVVGPDVTQDFDDLEYVRDDEDGMIVITHARIAGATLVQIPAFADVSIEMADAVEGAEPEPGLPTGKIYTGHDWSLLTAGAAPPRPPLAWFMKPDLDRVTPLTVSDTGRVFGHIAPWGECHVGLPGCVTAPSSPSSYAYFHQGEQALDDGTTMPVGTLTVGGGHADAQLAWRPAQDHYDNVGTAVAKVVAGEDEFGIWVAGWILPQATPEQLDVFRSSPVSGDWRRIGGALEMVAVCSVNSAGFPVPRARVAFSSGAQQALVGSFGIVPVRAVEVAEVSTGLTPVVGARARWAWAESQREG
jgi:hypothetical protein